MTRLSFLGFMILSGCCGFDSLSETIVYVGSVKGTIDTTIEIFGDDDGRPVLVNGVPRKSPVYPDSSGNYTVFGTTNSHSSCDNPYHWQSGPMEVLVRGENIRDTLVTFPDDVLKGLPQVDLDSLKLANPSIRGESQILGAWRLPDIMLTKKGDSVASTAGRVSH